MPMPDQRGHPPFSPETLAERWQCSPEKVRRMVKSGGVAAFRLDRLIRIPASEVERIECQTLTASFPTAANMLLALDNQRFVDRLARMTGG
jgi:excisionase family DNA binding protein